MQEITVQLNNDTILALEELQKTLEISEKSDAVQLAINRTVLIEHARSTLSEEAFIDFLEKAYRSRVKGEKKGVRKFVYHYSTTNTDSLESDEGGFDLTYKIRGIVSLRKFKEDVAADMGVPVNRLFFHSITLLNEYIFFPDEEEE